MPKPKIGEIFQKRYLILSELGAGGMGFVFRARQIDADREVALKSIRSDELQDQDTIARFYREFKLLAKLSHPNIVTIYGLSLDDHSIPFAICELIEGDNLRSILSRDGPITWERASKIVSQICLAMQYAHEQGVIHRDLKPDNVMLLKVPEPDFVKLVDFGLSRVFQSDGDVSQALTSTGQLLGSANYLSPELVKQRADERSDVYSLGCLLYELLSARMLFDADTAVGIVYKHCNEDPMLHFNEIKSQVPKRLLAILSKMLAKNPDERYQSMKELAAEIQFLNENPGEITGDFRNLKFDKGKPKTGSRIKLFVCIACVGLLSTVIAVMYGDIKIRESARTMTISKDTPLPRRAVAAIAVFMREQNLELRKSLILKWLSKNKLRGVSAEDRLMVLDCLAKTQFSLQEIKDGRKTLKEIVELLPSVPDASEEQRITKASSYRLVIETNLTIPNNDGAERAAIDCINMIKRGDVNMGMVGLAHHPIMTLFLCGSKRLALDLQESFKGVMNHYEGHATFHYFQLLGDLLVCNGRVSEGLSSYKIARSRMGGVTEKSSEINKLYAIEVGKDGYTGSGSYSGLPLFSVASRISYLDTALGLKLLKESVDLIEEEQLRGINVKAGQAISRAYVTFKLSASTWLQMAIAARELTAVDEALRCSSMAVRVAESDMDKKALDPAYCECMAFCIQANFEDGKVEEGKRLFKKLDEYFKRFDSPTRYELEFRYTSQIAVAAFSKHDASAGDYARQSIDAWEKWATYNSLESRPDLSIALGNAYAVVKQESKAIQYWNKAASRVETAEGDAFYYSVMAGLRPDGKDLEALNAVMQHCLSVKLVESYLSLGFPQRAEAFALALSSRDGLSKAVGYYKMADYYLEGKKMVQASQYYKKANAEFLKARKCLPLANGLPFPLRCQFMIERCKKPVQVI